MESEALIALGRIEEQTKGISAMLAEHKAASNKRLDNHSERIASLEHSRAKSAGVIAAVSFASSGLIAVIWKLIAKQFGG